MATPRQKGKARATVDDAIRCPFTGQVVQLVECAADEYGIKRWMGAVTGGWCTILFESREKLVRFLKTRNGVPPKEEPKPRIEVVGTRLPPVPDLEAQKGKQAHEAAQELAGRIVTDFNSR